MTGEEYKEGETGMTREGKDGIVHDEDAFRQQDATRCRAQLRDGRVLSYKRKREFHLEIVRKSQTNLLVNYT